MIPSFFFCEIELGTAILFPGSPSKILKTHEGYTMNLQQIAQDVQQLTQGETVAIALADKL
ncbi:MAG: hypothetical protein ACKO2V_03830 [Snowella sp.]